MTSKLSRGMEYWDKIKITRDDFRNFGVIPVPHQQNQAHSERGLLLRLPKGGRRVRNDGTNFYLILANCAQGFPNLCPLYWAPIRGKILGAKEMLAPPNWAIALEMPAQISTQFVPIVFRSPKICTPSLLSLFMKQVWGGWRNTGPPDWATLLKMTA